MLTAVMLKVIVLVVEMAAIIKDNYAKKHDVVDVNEANERKWNS